jgi:hypothetical protein
MPTPLRLRELLERLVEAEIRFVLVGGLAVNAWGYLRATRDVDLVPDPEPSNLEKIDALLTELGGRVDVDGELLAPLGPGLTVRICSYEHPRRDEAGKRATPRLR